MPEKNIPINPNKIRGPEVTEERKEISPPEPVKFPWLMFFLAILFDLIGLIPFLNFLTEAIAGFIFGFWQKMYVPKTDPIITFIIAKIIDAISLGILPSNLGIVVYAYIKKKAASKIDTPIGKIASSKLTKQVPA